MERLPLGDIQKAKFLGRPNRFLVLCRLEHGTVVTAFLPNPGRLWELLLPGVTLTVSRNAGGPSAVASDRKTQYTVLAVQRDGSPIFLHTHLNNRVARRLIELRKIPALADAEVVRAEVPVGNHRFDFLLQQGRRRVLLEVKSCTLYGNGVAMFPDAVTERGRKHLLELASLRDRSTRSVVLFLVHCPDVDWFMPDYHTDLAFAQAMLHVRRSMQILPVATEWNADLSFSTSVRTLDIPWAFLRREVVDRGSYLLLLRLDQDCRVQVGQLGSYLFRQGHYVYVGSAMNGLSARMARHIRRRKKLHWHIDYLRQAASHVVALPIRSSARQECEVAAAFSRILSRAPAGFGSSDCSCATHLFRHASDPLTVPAFHETLQRFRMRRP